MSSATLRDLKWSVWLHREHHDAMVASYGEEFNGLTGTVLEELAPRHPDYDMDVCCGTNCCVILKPQRLLQIEMHNSRFSGGLRTA